MRIKNFFQLISTIFVCEAAGIVGSLFTTPAIGTWYTLLEKPSFNPPGWVFGPVWTLLYALMGVAAWLVWQNGWKKKEVKNALTIFLVQLVLNALWSILFFGLHSPATAFVDIVILWLAIIAAIVSFWKISRPAGYLLLPYIVWVSFAAVLNLAIWIIN